MSGNRFKVGLFGGVKRLTMVPGVVDGRQEPEVALGIPHHPLLGRLIYKESHHVLRYSGHILFLTEQARLTLPSSLSSAQGRPGGQALPAMSQGEAEPRPSAVPGRAWERANGRSTPSSSSFSFFLQRSSRTRTSLYGSRRRSALRVLPQAKPAQERISVVARSATWRQLFQFLSVASANHHLIGVESSDQAFNPILHMALPFLSAKPP